MLQLRLNSAWQRSRTFIDLINRYVVIKLSWFVLSRQAIPDRVMVHSKKILLVPWAQEVPAFAWARQWKYNQLVIQVLKSIKFELFSPPPLFCPVNSQSQASFLLSYSVKPSSKTCEDSQSLPLKEVLGTERCKNWHFYTRLTHFPFRSSLPMYLMTRMRPERVPRKAVSTPSSTLQETRKRQREPLSWSFHNKVQETHKEA